MRLWPATDVLRIQWKYRMISRTPVHSVRMTLRACSYPSPPFSPLDTIYCTLSPSPKGIVLKCSCLLQLTSSLPPSTDNSLLFFSPRFSLPFQFSLLNSLPPLFSCHFTHFSTSRPFLLSLCHPQGVWDRLGDSLYVPLSWPELPSWGSFDGVGDYSSCSLGRIRLSHQQQQQQQHHMHIHSYTYWRTLEKYPHQCFLLRNF